MGDESLVSEYSHMTIVGEDRPKKPKAGGRAAGTPNKVTKTLKEAILGALKDAGGQAYLLRVAKDDPKTFCTLIGRVLPLEVSGANGAPIAVTITKFSED